MRVLICEGNATIALDLWWLLHEQGHCVCGVARSTSDCLDKAVEKRPDLVMVDDHMEDSLTGIRLVETLAMSGFASVIVSREPHRVASTSSARAVLPKPVCEAALASALARAGRGGPLQVATT